MVNPGHGVGEGGVGRGREVRGWGGVAVGVGVWEGGREEGREEEEEGDTYTPYFRSRRSPVSSFR